MSKEKLGGISDEIRVLQEQSLSMNVRVKNRRSVEEHYFQMLDKVIASDKLIIGICQGDVNDDYMTYVQELEEKLGFIHKTQDTQNNHDDELCGLVPDEVLAVLEVKPLLERLRIKTASRLREFFVQQFMALKKTNTNVQILQQNVLLKYKCFMKFLAQHVPEVAEELKTIYIDTMSRILHSTFKHYYENLNKLDPNRGRNE